MVGFSAGTRRGGTGISSPDSDCSVRRLQPEPYFDSDCCHYHFKYKAGSGSRQYLSVTGNLTGLPKDSVVNISQIVTVDKNFITEQVGVLPSDIMEKVEERLRLVLCL